MDRGEEYQRLVTTLKEGGGVVQGEMVDRVLDGGESLFIRPSPPPASS